jgi:hypothetical protein
MREKDRRKYQRIKAQDFARANHTEMRKLICVHVPGYLMAAAQMSTSTIRFERKVGVTI